MVTLMKDMLWHHCVFCTGIFVVLTESLSTMLQVGVSSKMSLESIMRCQQSSLRRAKNDTGQWPGRGARLISGRGHARSVLANVGT